MCTEHTAEINMILLCKHMYTQGDNLIIPSALKSTPHTLIIPAEQYHMIVNFKHYIPLRLPDSTCTS